MQKDSLYTRFLAGAIASSTAEMATLPVDITKVRLQAQGMTTSQGMQYNGMFDAVRKIAKYEGIGALWNGVQPAVARQIVYSSMCMVLYEPFRDAIMMVTQPDTTQTTMSFAQKLMAGGLAGAISISIANP
ncbi:Mitochondrial Carrier (MC) Family [Thraustotheca clavata]|uniref:Mitochondrial Carrier (MC) Family n=1 Tax=Thraustotheca clavata TaxID=74557 RepID=A0A1V9YB85_9STRA|nr:Mitochondrial Carrier (MC) Family [Thraustotheca clavata]